MERPPPEPPSKGVGYCAANEAVLDGEDPIEWLEGAWNRISEELHKAS